MNYEEKHREKYRSSISNIRNNSSSLKNIYFWASYGSQYLQIYLL